MVELILLGLFGLIYLLFNELEDECVRNTWKRHTEFLNTKLSHVNKWAYGLQPNYEKHWYYFGFDPPLKEDFYLSSTLFVWYTDGEHLFQFIKNRAIEASLLVIGWEYALAWFVGKSLMQLIKEKFIKAIN